MTELTYGYFPGGGYDPRRFAPDVEVCTPDEIAAWERACKLREEGVVTIERASGAIVDGCITCGSLLGMGTYEIEVDDEPPDGGEPLPLEAARVA